MSGVLNPPIELQLSDSTADRVRRSHHKAIVELQKAIPRIISDVSLPDGKVTLVAHQLGRAPTFFACSPPRGPVTSGRIEEIRDKTIDRTRYLALKASGYGATITVDLEVQ